MYLATHTLLVAVVPHIISLVLTVVVLQPQGYPTAIDNQRVTLYFQLYRNLTRISLKFYTTIRHLWKQLRIPSYVLVLLILTALVCHTDVPVSIIGCGQNRPIAKIPKSVAKCKVIILSTILFHDWPSTRPNNGRIHTRYM